MIYKIVLIMFLTSDILANVTCSNPKTECIEAGGTRYFENIPVTLDCWRYKVTYECKETADDNCQTLRDQGCAQIGAKCKVMFSNTCVVQDETYRCPVNKCPESKVSCVKNAFCMGGNCATPRIAEDKNFDKAVASFAALLEVSNDVQKQHTENPEIFKGRYMECSENFFESITKNCCGITSSGMLEGVVLHCDAEEKELAQMKEAGRAIAIGKYCHNDTPFGCSSHHTGHCVFNSKIARIIQQYGRKQLGISFGEVGSDHLHPNCRGITKLELARLDFSKMDFSELYAELKAKAKEKMPTKDTVQKKLKSYTYEELKNKVMKKDVSQETSIELKAAERIKEFYEKRAKK